MRKLCGVVTPMVTPFLNNEDVDVDTLRVFTSRLVDSGVNGLYPCGTTGEGHLLTMEERKLVAETVVAEAAGRVPVYIQSGAMSMRDTVELSLHAVECGADGVGVVTPSYYTLSQQDIAAYYVSLSEALPLDFPIYMYSIPSAANNDILPKTADGIAQQAPNIVGIKYSGDDFVQLEAYTEIRDRTFSVLAGNDRTFAAVLSTGCDGSVSGLSNVFSKKLTAAYRAFLEKDIEGSMALQRQVYNDSSCLFNGFFLANLKAGIGFSGLPVGKLRKPLPELTEDQYESLKEAFERLDL